MLQTPLWITNFKNYEQAVGANAIKLAKIHEKVSKETGVSIAIAVNALDVARVAEAVSIPVFAQHIDACDYGSFTGYILPQAVKKAGAAGTLLNHSERRIDPEILGNLISYAQKGSLCRIVCAENAEEVEKIAEYDPDFIAYEPPELIGSTDISVATAKPEVIADSVQAARHIPLLVGAGINNVEDIKIALKLGAKGFLVASAIVKSSDPEKTLREMVEPLRG